MKDKNVAISIVTYNSKHIFNVLENLKAEFGQSDRYRFLIFDNNSEEEYKRKLSKYKDFAEITFHSSNEGFGFGHNQNLLKSSEEYFLIFNPDIILEKNNLDQLIDNLDQDPTISLIVPKVLNSDGTTQYLIRDRVSVLDYALRFVPFAFIKRLFSKRLHTYECRDLPDDHNSDIRIGSGCFMLIRSEAFKEVNGFDERYFMYFEDYDLCVALNNRGKRVVYSPTSTVTHYYERGAHKNFTLFKIFIRSMIKYFNKWGWRFF